jgi:competence protein ComFC
VVPSWRPGQQVLEALFPGRCLLCGEWLFLAGDPSIPLCEECSDGIRALGGTRCERCGIELISERGTCLRCRTADFSFDLNVSLFSYSGLPKRLLAALKFRGRVRLAPFFAGHAAAALKILSPDGAVVVPAPPRQGRRSPDAVELVVRSLESGHGISVLRLLSRAGVVQQKSLDYEQRRENLKGMISLSPGSLPLEIPAEVVLLDDVFTTGATLDACASALRDAGCRSVKAITLVIEE